MPYKNGQSAEKRTFLPDPWRLSSTTKQWALTIEFNFRGGVTLEAYLGLSLCQVAAPRRPKRDETIHRRELLRRTHKQVSPTPGLQMRNRKSMGASFDASSRMPSLPLS